MAAPLAFSRIPFSHFKGDVGALRTKPSPFPSSAVGSFHLTKRKGENQKTIGFGVVVCKAASAVMAPSSERFRLHNLTPQPGSRKRAKRKGRGIAAGQGNSCGFGMKGQKSRSGPGVRRGFEGGTTPLYRRIPKLKGIAGGMHKGLPKFVVVNLQKIEDAGFQEGDEVSLETLKNKRLINPSGRERRLPLKILGDGELTVKLNVKAHAFSASAKEKLEAAGSTLTVLPGKKKWLKPAVLKNLARADEYFAKKRAAAAGATADSISA
ncbi:hypothetical protein MRB53_008395 [Persea americana]|uniref:Uncharacterized protein n=1 Tax=Persea americana TaxID=3435 RepID=A0ACC2MLK1_PERAE|nr:hypothetical protein MRB53_008395 [Persea americana]|eukprot:TRINITY_DN407_c0_g1_i1.p1 TRINITY_DN407_c0_g1~~TRINITY_DN407_c0_g1_i1.p1  ORF type:complete len:288 (+),score=76.11 TRINITY_DN407_c0_g1_i1:67-864(+)